MINDIIPITSHISVFELRLLTYCCNMSVKYIMHFIIKSKMYQLNKNLKLYEYIKRLVHNK